MGKLKEVKKLFGLKGRTIADTRESRGELWIKFTDDSFVVLVVKDKSEPHGYRRDAVCVNDYEKDATDEELVDLGLITRKEYDDANKQEEVAREERHKQYEEEIRLKNEAYELKQLEILSNKYKSH